MDQVFIGFECDPGIVPWLIRKLTRFPYNHVLFIFQSADWEREWTFESVSSAGVRAVPLRPSRSIRDRFRVKYDIGPDLLANQELVSEKYDFLGLLMFGLWFIIKNIFQVRLSFSGITLKGQQCSELVATVLRNRFYHELEHPQWVTPRDIFELMKKRPDDFEPVAEGSGK